MLKDKAEFSNFIIELLKRCVKADISRNKTKSTLISPLSLISALGMTASGAKADTLAQIEEVIGTDIDTLNHYMKEYNSISDDSTNYKVNTANSIWINNINEFKENKDFLQKTIDYYNAGVFKIEFDNAAKDKINNWVRENTNGMIEKILDMIFKDSLMYLINAVSFDAKWTIMYDKHNVQNGKFTNAEGKKVEAEFMYSEESNYIEDENATGFIKYYKGRRYAFAALLPKEDKFKNIYNIEEYVSCLTKTEITDIIENVNNKTFVHAAIPKFSLKSSYKMEDILMDMGIKDAFSSQCADFSGIGTYEGENICISNVLHDTVIEVNEAGTKAAAVSAVCIVRGTAFHQSKEVILNRPFVFMIIDCNSSLPLFIGTVVDL